MRALELRPLCLILVALSILSSLGCGALGSRGPDGLADLVVLERTGPAEATVGPNVSSATIIYASSATCTPGPCPKKSMTCGSSG